MYIKVVLLQRIGRDLERESEKFSSRLPLSENAKRIFLRNKAELRVANHTGKRVRLGFKNCGVGFPGNEEVKEGGRRAQGHGGVRCDGRERRRG